MGDLKTPINGHYEMNEMNEIISEEVSLFTEYTFQSSGTPAYTSLINE